MWGRKEEKIKKKKKKGEWGESGVANLIPPPDYAGRGPHPPDNKKACFCI